MWRKSKPAILCPQRKMDVRALIQEASHVRLGSDDLRPAELLTSAALSLGRGTYSASDAAARVTTIIRHQDSWSTAMDVLGVTRGAMPSSAPWPGFSCWVGDEPVILLRGELDERDMASCAYHQLAHLLLAANGRNTETEVEKMADLLRNSH